MTMMVHRPVSVMGYAYFARGSHGPGAWPVSKKMTMEEWALIFRRVLAWRFFADSAPRFALAGFLQG